MPIGECIIESKVKDDKVIKLSNRGTSQLQDTIGAISEYLLRTKRTFYCISRSSGGPYHLAKILGWSWSRLVSEMHKSRSACMLSTNQKIEMRMRPNGEKYQPSRPCLKKGGIVYTEI